MRIFIEIIAISIFSSMAFTSLFFMMPISAKELFSVLSVPTILLAAFFIQLNIFRLARKKRKDDLFQLRYQFFKRLLEFWKQNKIDLKLTETDIKLQKEEGVFFMEGDYCQDGMNPKAIEYLNEKRNLITEAGF